MTALWLGTRFRAGILAFLAAVALAVALGWLAAPNSAAAFKLVSCPPGGAPNVACPAPDGVGGASSGPATTWLGRHLGATWLSLLFIGTVALSETARAGLEHQVRRKGALLPRAARPHELLLPRPLGPRAVRLLACCLALVLGSLALGAAAFSRPTSHEVTVITPYQQHGSFSYSAPASGGIYDGDSARTGQPIFPRLSNAVDLTFAYSFAATGSDLTGTAWLSAVVGDSSGWSKSIELHPEMSFSGTTASISGTLDLKALQGIIDDYERESGLHPGSYRVSIAPQVRVRGSLDGAYFEDAFTPKLDFILDQSSLRLAEHPANIDPLSPAASGAASDLTTQARAISLGVFSLPVSLLRWLATAGLLLALGGVFGVLWVAGNAPPPDEVARIRARYGRRLIAIQPGSLEHSEVVEVRAIDDLGRLAERERLPILVDDGTPRYYYVRHGELLYRYRLLTGTPLSPDLEQDLFG